MTATRRNGIVRIVKLACSIGSAGYPWFTELNICATRAVLGSGTPIVITEDASSSTQEIIRIAERRDCYLHVCDPPLGHFQGDIQTSLNALSLAESEGAHIAAKISQRFILAHPEVRKLIVEAFTKDPALAVICPGRPNPAKIRKGHRQFSRFAMLSDIMFMRTGAITADQVRTEYLHQVRTGTKYYDSFAELFWHRFCEKMLGKHYWMAPDLTDHSGRGDCRYLRRYQNHPNDYQRLADMFGLGTHNWDLRERASITKNYDPRPRI